MTTMQMDRYDGNEGHGSGRRIPLALQSVFLASNRGQEVNKPPPDSSACKVYTRRWFGLRRVEVKKDSSEATASCRSPKKPAKKKVSRSNRRRSVPPPVPELENVFVPKPIAPHAYLESLLQSRGYSCKTVKATECAYYNKATPLQEASYGTYMVEVIRENDTEKLRELLEVGLSPNASNSHNESIVHLACRMGHAAILQTLLEYGCKLQVCDDNGRTPLHEACWAAEPSLEVVELILATDWQMLLVADSRGYVPLTYMREGNWSAFTKFLVKNKDTYWPDKLFGTTSDSAALVSQKPNTSPVQAPKANISIQLARLAAQGKMSPEEVEFLVKGDEELVDSDEESLSNDDDDDEDDTSDYDDDDDDDDDHDDNDDDDDTSLDSGISFDEQEMAELLASIGTMAPVAW